MFLSAVKRLSSNCFAIGPGRATTLIAVCAVSVAITSAGGQTVSKPEKHIIGATAVLTEAISGLPFAARIDTGAASCSLHVEKMEIEGEQEKPLRNIGKPIRFQVKNEKGKTAWIEAKIAAVVRVRSSALKDGEVDRRYKVPLTLKWGDVSKEVLVTLNDRTDMKFPLLVGRNYLTRDFLVDVDLDSFEEPLAADRDK
jgi:hypothetical protein